MDKTIWCQLHLWFDSEECDTESNNKNRLILSGFLEKIKGKYKRFFYLYEHSPTIFMAIETNKPDEIYATYSKYKFPASVKKHALYIRSDDRSNGIEFLSILCEFCKFTLSGSWNLKVHGRPQKGFISLNHLVHCILDSFYGSREDERKFYEYQLKYYKPVRKR